ncbi:alpha/beta hydrolase [Limnohabitans sp. Bal53]|uniref:alpha/beta hydrolase n=1 Tax=Limnohabitans sp. Bal53 TaxID=1977910 RepID=UPI000D35FA08|nr:alpha/beta hydrolase [Limnohabitans sp. Bal53]PUE42921.1 acetyl hydrolase [Limnohabitans sp. Bal53]
MLDPQAQDLMNLMIDKGIPPVHTQTPTEARASYRARRSFTQPDAPEVGRVQELSFQHSGVDIAVRVYHPAAVSPALPALVYLHGGGWTIGDLDTHDVLCRSLCQQAGGVVVAVDYRLGPEHKFPAGYDDAVAAWQWVASQAAALGIDPARIAIGGDSAGGNLAAAACLGLRDLGLKPVLQLLIYPSTLMAPETASYQTNGQGYMLTRESMAWYSGNYLRGPQDTLDWRASPQLATSHANLPPALVLTAGFDPLRDEGLMYADALSRAGVPAQYICFERQIHGFITMGRVLQEANTAVAVCAQALRTAWTQG